MLLEEDKKTWRQKKDKQTSEVLVAFHLNSTYTHPDADKLPELVYSSIPCRVIRLVVRKACVTSTPKSIVDSPDPRRCSAHAN